MCDQGSARQGFLLDIVYGSAASCSCGGRVHSEYPNLTELVNLWKNGDRVAGNAVFAAVQLRLRKIANLLLHEHGGYHRLQATEIVDQAYTRMLQERKANCLSRAEFFYIATKLIDRTILDAMRYDRAGIRDFRMEVSDQENQSGDFQGRASYDGENLMLEQIGKSWGSGVAIGGADLDRLDRALDELKAQSQVAHSILIRRIFNDDTFRCISQDLKISEDAALRKWQFARAFLADRLDDLRKSTQS
jgi:ECF sigma factor